MRVIGIIVGVVMLAWIAGGALASADPSSGKKSASCWAWTFSTRLTALLWLTLSIRSKHCVIVAAETFLPNGGR